jgi:flagellar hook-associated protein 1 FlgK
MSIMGANFAIGRTALATYQSSLAVVGQNIANVGNPEYSRQRGHLTALQGGLTPSGLAPGSGIAMDRLLRHVDVAVESRMRAALSTRSNAETTQRALIQLENLYNELTDADLSTGLSTFFSHFSSLQLNPQDSSTRGLILSSAESLVAEFRRLREGLAGQVQDMNRTVQQAVERVDALAKEIADLNVAITSGDARATGGASALRDRRDGLIRELSQYVDVQIREHESGSVSVYVNSDPLVQDGRARGLRVDIERQDGVEIFQVRFTDDGGLMRFRDGQLAGVVNARDEQIRGQIEKLDQLARGLIYEVNRIQSTGVGLQGYASLTGSYAVRDAGAPLNAAGNLPFPVKNGVMIVNVRNASSGQMISRQIEVDLDGLNGDDTSLNSLAAALNGVPGLSSVVTADGRLQIAAAPGSEVWFSEDTSGALAALGVGSFFTGIDSSTIELNGTISANQNLIAASRTGDAADGANAARFAELAQYASSFLGGKSITQFQGDLFSAVAVGAAAAETRYEAADAVFSGLMAQREATSGVNLDEEAINLSKFQTAYAGAARYVSVLQQMSEILMSIVQ